MPSLLLPVCQRRSEKRHHRSARMRCVVLPGGVEDDDAVRVAYLARDRPRQRLAQPVVREVHLNCLRPDKTSVRDGAR